MPRITTRDHQRGHKPELLLAQAGVPDPSVYREVQRAERVARQLACKTFDQMAGELKAWHR